PPAWGRLFSGPLGLRLVCRQGASKGNHHPQATQAALHGYVSSSTGVGPEPAAANNPILPGPLLASSSQGPPWARRMDLFPAAAGEGLASRLPCTEDTQPASVRNSASGRAQRDLQSARCWRGSPLVVALLRIEALVPEARMSIPEDRAKAIFLNAAD